MCDSVNIPINIYWMFALWVLCSLCRYSFSVAKLRLLYLLLQKHQILSLKPNYRIKIQFCIWKRWVMHDPRFEALKISLEREKKKNKQLSLIPARIKWKDEERLESHTMVASVISQRRDSGWSFQEMGKESKKNMEEKTVLWELDKAISYFSKLSFSSVQLLSRLWLFVTP